MGFGKNFLILRHASVGIEELRYLTETDLCQIFPSVEVVGTKAKLREKIKLWKKDEFGEGEDLTAALQKVNEWLKHNDRHQSSTSPSIETPRSQCSFELSICVTVVIFKPSYHIILEEKIPWSIMKIKNAHTLPPAKHSKLCY
ncbi:uncharacterized protein [Eurosta solidaginis]